MTKVSKMWLQNGWLHFQKKQKVSITFSQKGSWKVNISYFSEIGAGGSQRSHICCLIGVEGGLEAVG